MAEESSSQSQSVPWMDPIAGTWWPEIYQSVLRPMMAGDYSAAVAQAATILEERVRDFADAPPDCGGTNLGNFAFAPPNGALTQHVPGGEAAGYKELFNGLTMSTRNKVHHNSRTSVPSPESIQAIGAINYCLTAARHLATETYLKEHVSSYAMSYLLKVKHFDLDGDGTKERIVTFAHRTGEFSTGQVIIRKEDGHRWKPIPGARCENVNGYLDGSIHLAYCRPDIDRPQFFSIFSPNIRSGVP